MITFCPNRKGCWRVFHDIVNSTPMQVIFTFFSIVLLISFILYVYIKIQIKNFNIQVKNLKKQGKKLKIESNEKYSKRITLANAVVSWIVFFDVIFTVLIVLFWFGVWNANSMKEKYARSISSEPSDSLEIFLENEGEEKVTENETDENLHKGWIDEQYEDGGIDKKRIEDYLWRTWNVFSASEEEYIVSQKEMQENSFEIQRLKTIFEEAVSTDHSKLTIKKCRKGYRAGIELIKFYPKSENVFQIAVLAENAYYFSVIDGTEEERQEDLAVAIKYFEDFTAFDEMDPGDGRIQSEFEIAFRIGKMLFREVKKLENGTFSENKRTASHLQLYAFECFKYAVEGVKKDDEKYILYLYYEGLGAFKLVEYIKETLVKKRLCSEVYRLFDAVSKEEIDVLLEDNFEKMNKNKFWKAKSQLEEYIN